LAVLGIVKPRCGRVSGSVTLPNSTGAIFPSTRRTFGRARYPGTGHVNGVFGGWTATCQKPASVPVSHFGWGSSLRLLGHGAQNECDLPGDLLSNTGDERVLLAIGAARPARRQ
jgi:hypothetical protein